MKIAVLTENTSCSSAFSCEHGLSLYLETGGKKILFDTGQSSLFAENAEKLGVDLKAVDLAILSHGHYDHGGGLSAFFEINDKASVYISRYAFDPHFNAQGKDIGLDPALKGNSRFILCGEETILSPQLSLFSCNEKPRLHAMSSAGMAARIGGKMLPDDFRHEQYLLAEEAGKRILISGCSHKGILDIVDWFSPDILIGGFHFMRLPLDSVLSGYARELAERGTKYYTCHCTGLEQYHYMQPFIPQMQYISTGMQIEV